MSDYLRPDISGCVPFIFLQIYNKDSSANREKEQGVMAISVPQNTGNHVLYFWNNNYYYEVKGSSIIRSGGIGIIPSKEKGTWILKDECHSLAVTWKVEKMDCTPKCFLTANRRQAKYSH